MSFEHFQRDTDSADFESAMESCIGLLPILSGGCVNLIALIALDSWRRKSRSPIRNSLQPCGSRQDVRWMSFMNCSMDSMCHIVRASAALPSRDSRMRKEYRMHCVIEV
ncbi:histidinol-phosphate aminotransferase 2 domain protein [Burkholderia pseudomallei MSHR7334]|nr:histidinol-phosphate aminotransferase 2 domain protein [Burkholderia pseudomallei MSHR7334]